MKKIYSFIAFCLLISYTAFTQTVSSNAPLCGNQNLTLDLTATGGTTYAWKGPNGFTSTQQKPNVKNVNYQNRGVYTVVVDGKTTLTTNVSINDFITEGGNISAGKTYCENIAPTAFESTKSASGNTSGIEYIWLKNAKGAIKFDVSDPNWILISGATRETYDPPLLKNTTSFIRVARSVGCTDYVAFSNISTIVINPIPTVKSLSDVSVCRNEMIALTIDSKENMYKWTGPDNFTSTLQSPNFQAKSSTKQSGNYSVTITNSSACTNNTVIAVTIKDPVAFTVPKEISVCEGGTLIIEPKSTRLTDSTEITSYYEFISPNGKIERNYYLTIKNFSNSDIGKYEVVGVETQTGCSTTQTVKVNLSNKVNCKSIEVGDLTKVKMCYGQEVSIPFTKKGDFKVGTKFKVYVHGGSGTSPTSETPTLVTEESPIILKNVNKFYNQTLRILIVADDDEKTVGLSNDRFFNPWYEYVSNYLSVSSQTCDSAKLSVSLTQYSSPQWYLDGKAINGAINKNFTVTKSGNYSFKFIGNNTDEKIDKTCLYESQPVKIELGKIPKPSAYVSNDIELCVGKPATLNVSTNTNTTYRWKKDGAFITNATKPTFETLQEGKYQIEAKEGTCTAVSDTVVLRKPERLNASFYVLQDVPLEYISGGVKLCNDQIYNLKGGVVYNNKFIETNLQWFKDNSILKDSIRNELSNLRGEGTYTLKAQYGQCSGTSSNYAIKYSKYLNAQTYNSSEFCEFTGGTINLSSARLLPPNNKTDYVLSKGTIYYEGNPLNDWLVINNNRYNSTIQVTKPGQYYAIGKLIFKDGRECLINTDTTNVTIVKKLQDTQYGFEDILKAVPLTTCKDTTFINSKNYNSVAYYYSGKEIIYKWTKNGTSLKQDSSSILQVNQAGLYQLETIYKGLPCPIVSSPYKVVFGEISVNFWNDKLATICDGQTFSLYPKLSEYSDKNEYLLFKDGQSFSNNKILLQNGAYYGYLNLTQSGTYKIKVTNGKCEGTSPDFVLKVDKIPTSITPSDSVTFCAGKTVDLKVSTEAGLSYIWERNNSVINQANQATFTASADGLYKATLLRGACWGITPSVKLKTLANIIPTATLTGDKKIDYDIETKLSINLTSHAPWTFKLSDGKEYTATKSPFEIAVKPLSTTTYSLIGVSNICGTGTVFGTAKIEVIILSAEEEKELNVTVFPVPSSEICNWKIETPQSTNATVEMVDVLGITQYSQISTTRIQIHEGTINLTNMKAGTYFLKLQAGEKSVVRKLVKY